MRLKRVGLNTMSCVITKSDMIELDYEPNNILCGQMSEEMAELANMVIGVLSDHLAPVMLPLGLPMEVRAMMHIDDIEFEISVPFLPFEVFDFDEDYDEEIDLEECIDDYEEEVDSTEEVDNISELNESENKGQRYDAKDEEITVMFKFQTLSDASEYSRMCQSIKEKPSTSLYKMDGYWMMCNFNNIDEKIIKQYLYILTEWKGSVNENKCKAAYIKEHGTQILKSKVLETLSTL